MFDVFLWSGQHWSTDTCLTWQSILINIILPSGWYESVFVLESQKVLSTLQNQTDCHVQIFYYNAFEGQALTSKASNLRETRAQVTVKWSYNTRHCIRKQPWYICTMWTTRSMRLELTKLALLQCMCGAVASHLTFIH